MLRRRHLLGLLGSSLAGGALLAAPRRARAAWGTWPKEQEDLAIAPGRRAKRVLEIYLYGGLCPWDTFYCEPTWGLGEERFLYAFGEAALAARLGACGVEGAATRPFAEDEAGRVIHLGPWTAPLWQRPDLLARTRVLVTRHDHFPHATAVPLCLTGAALGRPGAAGSGAAISRHFAELEGGAGPRAMVVHPGDLYGLDSVQSAFATGHHPSACRPLEAPLSRISELLALTERPGTKGHHEAHDALLAAQTAELQGRLRGPGGAPLVSPALETWRAVDSARRGASGLGELFPPQVLGIGLREACGESDPSIPELGLRVAVHALSSGLRYALCIDTGLRPALDGGHDTHRDHLIHAPRNYTHTLASLAASIAAPGEQGDPTKIDLDETLVVITSEFGRTPAREDERAGLGHWPAAGVSVLIGGPVEVSGIVGAVDPASAAATAWVSPAELRMAVMMAMGVHPFAPDAFVAAEVSPSKNQNQGDERGALRRLRALLGVEP